MISMKIFKIARRSANGVFSVTATHVFLMHVISFELG